ncbi:superoxide dismutase[Cu-Zn] [Nocardia huaxiensis]|uniref:Superoxide dismutase [Cu-Zn] n=1 Tax=Nocardia huaxiensis TaxID=2755382 RepID=A0A7D6ZX13_9NOCA|nr:superoxide dismutase family protein [Nocardia huaxiensis]QLY30689.1 superoxide dismutase family protein [Nocardia huaxiensis]UFS94181.1 superoxide dismutase family protein [Nocardia huaxiensis]
MAPSTTRRPSWRTVTPLLAVAALGLAGCSNSQESSDVKGTTPPVFTSSPAPAGFTTGHGGEQGMTNPPTESVSAQLKDSNGKLVGTATFGKVGGHLEVTLEANGLTPGFHGLHIHEVGECKPNSVAPTGGNPGDFLSAGGHLQVGAQKHPASGDLTSLEVRTDGSAKLVTTTDAVTLDEIKGKALIIHAGADNFGNIPSRYSQPGGATGPDADTQATGDAGGRVACGVIS